MLANFSHFYYLSDQQIMILTKKFSQRVFFMKIREYYSSHYDTLGIDQGASQQEIKTKYFQLAKKYHPDITKNTSDSAKFLKIKQAYQTLSDQSLRKQYDNTFSTRNYSNHQYQNQYPNDYARTSYYRYEQPAQPQHRPSILTLIRQSFFGILMTFAFMFMFKQILVFYRKKLDELDIQRQHAEISMNPHVIQKRKKMYAQEMKDKNIYGQLVEIKTNTLKHESTTSKYLKNESIESIQGIKKEKQGHIVSIVVKPQYM